MESRLAKIAEKFDLVEDGHDIRTVQELLGNMDDAIPVIDAHVPDRVPSGVKSPADPL